MSGGIGNQNRKLYVSWKSNSAMSKSPLNVSGSKDEALESIVMNILSGRDNSGWLIDFFTDRHPNQKIRINNLFTSQSKDPQMLNILADDLMDYLNSIEQFVDIGGDGNPISLSHVYVYMVANNSYMISMRQIIG